VVTVPGREILLAGTFTASFNAGRTPDASGVVAACVESHLSAAQAVT